MDIKEGLCALQYNYFCSFSKINSLFFSKPSASSSDAFLAASQLCMALHSTTAEGKRASRCLLHSLNAALVGSKCKTFSKWCHSLIVRCEELLSGSLDRRPSWSATSYVKAAVNLSDGHLLVPRMMQRMLLFNHVPRLETAHLLDIFTCHSDVIEFPCVEIDTSGLVNLWSVWINARPGHRH